MEVAEAGGEGTSLSRGKREGRSGIGGRWGTKGRGGEGRRRSGK